MVRDAIMVTEMFRGQREMILYQKCLLELRAC